MTSSRDWSRAPARDIAGSWSLARRFADDVVLNQVVIRFDSPDVGDSEAFHAAIASRVQSDGRCWLGSTTWQGESALRVSITNESTTEEDVSTAIEAVADAIRHVMGEPTGR